MLSSNTGYQINSLKGKLDLRKVEFLKTDTSKNKVCVLFGDYMFYKQAKEISLAQRKPKPKVTFSLRK